MLASAPGPAGGGPPQLQRGVDARGQLQQLDGGTSGVVDEQHPDAAYVDCRIGTQRGVLRDEGVVGGVEVLDAE